MKKAINIFRLSIILIILLFFSACDNRKKDSVKPSEFIKIKSLKEINKNEKIVAKNEGAKIEQLAFELSELTNVLNDFEFELKANLIAQKMWDFSYEDRKSINILDPLFVSEFTNIIKNAKTILKFSKPLSVGLASDKDLVALINILLYADTISANPLEKSKINSLIAFMYNRMLDFNTQLYYSRKQFNYAKQSDDKQAIIKAYGSLTQTLANLDNRNEALKLCDEISNVAPDYSAYFKCQCQPLAPKEIDNTIAMYEKLVRRKDICKDVRNMAEGDLRMLKRHKTTK